MSTPVVGPAQPSPARLQRCVPALSPGWAPESVGGDHQLTNPSKDGAARRMRQPDQRGIRERVTFALKWRRFVQCKAANCDVSPRLHNSDGFPWLQAPKTAIESQATAGLSQKQDGFGDKSPIGPIGSHCGLEERTPRLFGTDGLLLVG